MPKFFQSSMPKVGFSKYLWMKPVVCCVRLTPLTDGTNLNAYAYDMLVWGENNEQHNERLIKLLERLRAIGLQLNKDKCKIGLTEIPYIGHLLSEQGVKPDPSKVDAIKICKDSWEC